MKNKPKNKSKLKAIENCPKSLYKYQDINSEFALKSLENQEMWLSKPVEFNDPYDCAISMNVKDAFYNYINRNKINNYVNYFKKIRNGMLSSISIPQQNSLKKEFREEFGEEIFNEVFAKEINFNNLLEIFMKQEKAEVEIENIINDLRNNTYIGCFSEIKNSILMWSHYSNKHTGFCVEYDFSEIEKMHHRPFGVDYTKKIDNLNNISEALPDNNMKVIIQALITKSEEWSYEKEWRILEQPSMKEKNDEKGKVVKMPIPIAIYMGCRISSDNEEKLLTICKNKNIKPYKMEIQRNAFELKPKEV